MEYKFSQEYLAKRKRGCLFTAGIFGSISVAMAVYGIYAKEYELLFGLVFLLFSWQTVPSLKYWTNYGPSVYLKVSDREIVSGNSDQEGRQSLDCLKKMTVQKKGGEIKSILLSFETGELNKIEGFNNLPQLATEIEKVIGADKIKVSTWFHR